jgi:hypothetical protein
MKAKELARTILMAIPCRNFDERVKVEPRVKAEPKVTAQYLDRYAVVIASFFDLHGNMAN